MLTCAMWKPGPLMAAAYRGSAGGGLASPDLFRREGRRHLDVGGVPSRPTTRPPASEQVVRDRARELGDQRVVAELAPGLEARPWVMRAEVMMAATAPL